MVILRNQIIYIGDLKSREQVSLNGKKREIYSTNSIYRKLSSLLNIDNQKTGVRINTHNREESIAYEKLNALNYTVLSYAESLEEKAMLIGFDTKHDQTGIQSDSGYHAFGVTCIRADITDVGFKKGSMYYQPFVREYAEVKDGYYESFNDTVFGDDTIIMYPVGQFKTDITLHFNQQEVDKSDSMTKGFDGEIYLYNQITNKYDLLDYQNGKLDFRLKEAYIQSDNTITVKYKTNLTEMTPYAKLPFISMTGRY